jgi:secondary thiamine-phosphate synthase enzyme
MRETILLNTERKFQLVNITSRVTDVVAKSEIEEGICLVFAPHATAAIFINEDEPGFKADAEKIISQWIPEGSWQHNQIDDNATSHLGSALIGQSRVVPVDKGGLDLGTWQEIFLVELDGPRTGRKIIVQIVGAK